MPWFLLSCVFQLRQIEFAAFESFEPLEWLHSMWHRDSGVIATNVTLPQWEWLHSLWHWNTSSGAATFHSSGAATFHVTPRPWCDHESVKRRNTGGVTFNQRDTHTLEWLHSTGHRDNGVIAFNMTQTVEWWYSTHDTDGRVIIFSMTETYTIQWSDYIDPWRVIV